MRSGGSIGYKIKICITLYWATTPGTQLDLDHSIPRASVQLDSKNILAGFAFHEA